MSQQIINDLSTGARLAAATDRANGLGQTLFLSFIQTTRQNDNNAIFLLAAAHFSATLILNISHDQNTPEEVTKTFFLDALKLALLSEEPTP